MVFAVEDGENVAFDHGGPQFAAVVVPDRMLAVALPDNGDLHVIVPVHRRGRPLVGIPHAERYSLRTLHCLDRITIHDHPESIFRHPLTDNINWFPPFSLINLQKNSIFLQKKDFLPRQRQRNPADFTRLKHLQDRATLLQIHQ